MTETKSTRAHLIAAAFHPDRSPGRSRLRPSETARVLAEQGVRPVANDFADVESGCVERLLITYVAGPYPMPPVPGHAALVGGGRPLARPARYQRRPRRAGRGRAAAPHGEDRASCAPRQHFLTHPPICKIRVDVKGGDSPLTARLGASFVVEDEPYFIELQTRPRRGSC